MTGLLLTGAGGFLATGDAGAFPTEDAIVMSHGDGTTFAVVDLPSLSAGDGALLEFTVGGSSVVTFSFPTGWDVLDTTTVGNVRRTSLVWYVADGTEGATITVGISETRHFAASVRRIKDWGDTPEALFAATAVNDPPEITPSGGEQKYLFIAGVSNRRGDNEYIAPPTDYVGMQQANEWDGANNVACRLATARRALEAASDDPGPFSVTGTAGNFHSWTIAVPPV